MGITINKFMNKFNDFQALPSGQSFTIKVTDSEATAAAQEYLAENKALVKQMIQKSAGMSLDVENPVIKFGNDEISMSAKGGKGFLKVNASLNAKVNWDGKLNVDVKSVDIPIVSVSPEKLNSIVEKPLIEFMNKVGEYAQIQSFKLESGAAYLEATKN